MNDYVPFMDLHPELELIPTSRVKIGISNFQEQYDYVQNFKRKGNKHKELFHLLVKNGKYGVLLHESGPFGVDSIALNAEFDSIDFTYKAYRTFGAIVGKDGKFGLVFWTYGVWRNKVYTVPTEYDSLVWQDNGRYKGVKENDIFYFDETGHMLP